MMNPESGELVFHAREGGSCRTLIKLLHGSCNSQLGGLADQLFQGVEAEATCMTEILDASQPEVEQEHKESLIWSDWGSA